MKLIALVDLDWGIGKDGRQIVMIPDDLKRFKALTMGKTVVMGRKTLETLPGRRPLPGRRNILFTALPDFCPEGFEKCASEDELLRMTAGVPGDDIFVIGGEAVYRLLLHRCSTAYITKVLSRFEADRHMVNLDETPPWHVVREEPEREFDGMRYIYTEYER